MFDGNFAPGTGWLFLVGIAICSAVVSWLTIALMLRLGHVGPIDQPNHRSLHRIAVPRSGGVGILCGTLIGMVATVPSLIFWIAFGSLVGISLLDDFRPLPARQRFTVQVAAAVAATWSLVPAEWGVAGQMLSVLGVVWMTNLYNFMDGANGLAGGMAIFGFSAYAVTAYFAGQGNLAVLSACIAAGAAGFLAFNFDPAKIFMGDVGSIPLGFLAAVTALQGVRLDAWPVWFPVLVFSVFIVDATWTLLRRIVRREKVWIAHREHLYQRMIRSGWSHRSLALAAYLLMFATAVSACLLLAAPPTVQTILIAAWVVVFLFLIRAIDRRTPGISVSPLP
jgi:UDP-N-acetylmuramyl pentapeptide phosphotransferase/UDP-N-acetylglucosamine-1-phosphate transferase